MRKAKQLRYGLEAAGCALLFMLLRALPLSMASWLGGALARLIGPHLGAHYTAVENLALAFPQKSIAERKRIAIKMWDNLGRVVAELPHFSGGVIIERMPVEGAEYLLNAGKQALFFSGHLGNWEMVYGIAYQHNLPLTLIYRHINNPIIDRMIVRMRQKYAKALIPKGAKGAKMLAKALRNGESVAMLIDQKYNAGIPVPFFGHDAMTAPAIAQLALRYNLPIIPARVLRQRGANFKGRVFPPLSFTPSGDDAADTVMILTKLNAILEEWIRETPEQWFWVHRRWPK